MRKIIVVFYSKHIQEDGFLQEVAIIPFNIENIEGSVASLIEKMFPQSTKKYFWTYTQEN